MTQSTLVTEPGNGTLEIFALPTDTELLRTLIAEWPPCPYPESQEHRQNLTH